MAEPISRAHPRADCFSLPALISVMVLNSSWHKLFPSDSNNQVSPCLYNLTAYSISSLLNSPAPEDSCRVKQLAICLSCREYGEVGILGKENHHV